MNHLLAELVERLGADRAAATRIIPWSCPVPVFGDLERSVVATLGLNPSNREFVDRCGTELHGAKRRLHTLNSLELDRWSDASSEHLCRIDDVCRSYFARNPYQAWFRSLDAILSGARCTYYGEGANACHLDLIPYATECKWTELTFQQRSSLISFAGDTLAHLLRDSRVRLLLLNGMTVVDNLASIGCVSFDREKVRSWTLPRKSGAGIAGYAFRGTITRLAGIDLGRPIAVLGYNHNIQSSFGVTAKVKRAIRSWFAAATKEVSLWDPPIELTDSALIRC